MSCADGWCGNTPCPKRHRCNCPVGLAASRIVEATVITPLEEDMSTIEYQVGDWFETNGHRWSRDKTGCWNGPGSLYVTDGHIEEFNLTVHPAPVVPTIVRGRVKRLSSVQQPWVSVPEEWVDKETLTVLAEGAQEGVVASAFASGQGYIKVTGDKLLWYYEGDTVIIVPKRSTE